MNPDVPVLYESEYFKGYILTMVRAEGSKWESNFAGKQRKFEVQIQVIILIIGSNIFESILVGPNEKASYRTSHARW